MCLCTASTRRITPGGGLWQTAARATKNSSAAFMVKTIAADARPQCAGAIFDAFLHRRKAVVHSAPMILRWDLAINNVPSVIPAKAGIQRHGLKRSNESGYPPSRV